MKVLTQFVSTGWFVILVTVSAVSWADESTRNQTEMTVGRYSVMRVAPTDAQIDLLSQIVTVSMPASVMKPG